MSLNLKDEEGAGVEKECNRNYENHIFVTLGSNRHMKNLLQDEFIMFLSCLLSHSTIASGTLPGEDRLHPKLVL